jgi:hypothetical protein
MYACDTNEYMNELLVESGVVCWVLLLSFFFSF